MGNLTHESLLTKINERLASSRESLQRINDLMTKEMEKNIPKESLDSLSCWRASAGCTTRSSQSWNLCPAGVGAR